MEYVCYQDNAEVQVEAVRVATELVQVGAGLEVILECDLKCLLLGVSSAYLPVA